MHWVSSPQVDPCLQSAWNQAICRNMLSIWRLAWALLQAWNMQPAGSRTILLKLRPGVFALVQFSRDSSSIVFLYHIGGCKAAGQAGAAGSASAGSRQTWTYLFTVAADGSNLWRVPVRIFTRCNCMQLHSTFLNFSSMLCRAGRHCTAVSPAADLPRDLLYEGASTVSSSCRSAT